MTDQNADTPDYSDKVKLVRNEDGSVTMTMASDYFDVLIDFIELMWDDGEEYWADNWDFFEEGKGARSLYHSKEVMDTFYLVTSVFAGNNEDDDDAENQ